jgi:hypothetical protein
VAATAEGAVDEQRRTLAEGRPRHAARAGWERPGGFGESLQHIGGQDALVAEGLLIMGSFLNERA